MNLLTQIQDPAKQDSDEAEFRHDRILLLPIDQITPSPENEKLYRPVDAGDPDIIALAGSIERNGLQESIVVTASSFGRSIRDDFGIDQVRAVKVALTHEQVESFRLPAGGKAKQGSSSYQKFVGQYGDDVWELESLSPPQLQTIATDAIDAVLDRKAFNHELDQEREDATSIEGTRRQVLAAMGVDR
jgi:hypothetical protein